MMDVTKRREVISGILVGMAEIYDKEISKETFKIFEAQLKNLTVEEIVRASELYIGNAANTKFPTPAAFIAALTPPDDTQARDAVSRIIYALNRFRDPYGHFPDKKEKAREYIGELGWVIVERQGGWISLSNAEEEEIGPIAQAQWREFLVGYMKKTRMGEAETPPALPQSPTQRKALESSNNWIPKLVKPE